MKKIIFFSFLIIVANICSFGQHTYFVDANKGNDSNNGLSPALAWKTIDKINQQTFSAGDIILFKRGEKWTGQTLDVSGYSGSATSLITFAAYPQTGDDDPIISTIVPQDIEWTSQGNNIWKADNPPTYHPERLFVNGIEILRANRMSELGSTFSWFYDAEQNGNLFLYSTTDPATDKISFTNGKEDINIDSANYIVFSELDLQGGWTSVFINSATSYIHFNKMKIGKYASNGIDINSENTSVPNHIHIKNCIFDAAFSLDYSSAGTYEGSDERGCSDAIFIQNAQYCEIDSNSFKNWGHASINIDGNPNGAANVKVSYISIHNNFLTSADICYGGRIALDDAHNCEIFDNKIINTSVQCQFNGYNNHIHHNIIYGTTNPPIVANNNEISAGISMESYASTEVHDNIIENNLIINTQGAGFRITTSGYHNIHDNIIRNNIFYNCGTVAGETGIGIKIDTNTSDCLTLNNIFYNNLVYNQNTENTIDFRGTITDIAGFNAFNGTSQYQIANNIAGNPLFVDVDNADYHLNPNSPCIDAGTTTLATVDFEGNAIPYKETAPDIGIYEFQSTNSINNYKYSNDIIIYPNPATNYINIKNNSAVNIYNISIVNEYGQEINKKGSFKRTIDISDFPAGIYFLKILTSKQIINKSFVKVE